MSAVEVYNCLNVVVQIIIACVLFQTFRWQRSQTLLNKELMRKSLEKELAAIQSVFSADDEILWYLVIRCGAGIGKCKVAGGDGLITNRWLHENHDLVIYYRGLSDEFKNLPVHLKAKLGAPLIPVVNIEKYFQSGKIHSTLKQLQERLERIREQATKDLEVKRRKLESQIENLE